MFKFGLIGCGTISKSYGEAISAMEDAALTAVFDANHERAREFAAKWNACAYESYENLLQSDVDAVCICLPSGLHVSYALKAAQAGKHVVLEKPIGITIEQLDELESALARADVKLCAISQLYFSDGFQTVKKAIDEGRLGKLYLMDVSMKYFRSDAYYREGGWRGTWGMDGGGALMNQGIHGVSLMQYLMGPVKSVRAEVRTLAHPIEVEDTAVAVIEFANGALGNLVGTTSVTPGYARRLSIHGEKGSITLREDQIEIWDVQGEEGAYVSDALSAGSSSDNRSFSSDLHRRQLTDFIDAVRTGRRPLLSFDEGRLPVELILAIYRSSQTGSTVYFDENGRMKK